MAVLNLFGLTAADTYKFWVNDGAGKKYKDKDKNSAKNNEFHRLTISMHNHFV